MKIFADRMMVSGFEPLMDANKRECMHLIS